jgi:hypothetical protein
MFRKIEVKLEIEIEFLEVIYNASTNLYVI